MTLLRRISSSSSFSKSKLSTCCNTLALRFTFQSRFHHLILPILFKPESLLLILKLEMGIYRKLAFGSRSFTTDSRESLNYDVVIVGAGPAGLSAAIRLKQLCKDKDVDLLVCVVEKGAQIGNHILSRNVFEPRALDELLPSWKQEEAPIPVPVTSNNFWLLSEKRAFSLPSPFNNK